VELGRQALAAGDLDQALALFRLALGRDPADMAAYAGLVRAYWQLGDEGQAERTLKAGLRLPFTTLEQTLPLRLVQADWLAAHGGRDQAMRVYGDIFSAVNQYTIIGPGTYGYSDRAWTIYHRLALPADLVPQFARADITPELDSRFAGLAQWYWDAGSRDTACLILHRVYREAPESESGKLRARLCT
jgi:tetratricopeptide (TPR) repeat protein